MTSHPPYDPWRHIRKEESLLKNMERKKKCSSGELTDEEAAAIRFALDVIETARVAADGIDNMNNMVSSPYSATMLKNMARMIYRKIGNGYNRNDLPIGGGGLKG